jgi:hypothetical protein
MPRGLLVTSDPLLSLQGKFTDEAGQVPLAAAGAAIRAKKVLTADAPVVQSWAVGAALRLRC